MPTRLLLTRRALVMFGGDPAVFAGQPATDLVELHSLVVAFVRKRSQTPDSGEATRGLTTRAIARNLHAGRSRGITWYDREQDICWLLGGGDHHAAGHHDDIYNELVALDRERLLFPTELDYLDAEGTLSPSPNVIAEVRSDRDSLLEEARQQAGSEIRRAFGKDLLGVGVLVEMIVEVDGEAELIYFGITLPEDEAVYNAAFEDLFAALLPDDADYDDLSYPHLIPAQEAYGEGVHLPLGPLPAMRTGHRFLRPSPPTGWPTERRWCRLTHAT